MQRVAQWGVFTHSSTHWADNRVITVPLSMTDLYCCIATTKAASFQACNAAYNGHTSTTITIRDGGVNDASPTTGFYWFIMCM